MTSAARTPTGQDDGIIGAQEILCRLRDRYRQDHDFFTQGELTQLSFVRWLVQSGRLTG